MLKRIASWKYAVAVTLIFGFFIYVAHQDQRTRDEYEKKCSQINSGFFSIASPYEDCDKGADNAARHLPRWYRLFGWPEGITTWAILLTLFAIAEQTGQTRKAAEASQRSVSAQLNAERAWVLIEGIHNPQSPLWFPGTNVVPGIVYQIKIYGNTPARIIRERYRCCILPAIPNTNPPQPQFDLVPAYKDELTRFSGSVSPQGYSYHQSVPLESNQPLTEQEFRDLQDKKTFLCSYCCIEYVDVFERKATTQACVTYDFALGGVAQSPDGTILNPPGFKSAGPQNYRKTT